MVLIEQLMRLAALDILPMDEPINYLLDIEPTDPLNEKFEGVGLESEYFLNNMGSLFLVYFCFPIVCLVNYFLGKCPKSCKRIHSLNNSLNQ